MFHLSPNPGLARLYPRVPRNMATECGLEDSTHPRVCLAPTIKGCLNAIKFSCELEDFWVYIPEYWRRHQKLYRPSVALVYDQEFTDEHWYTEKEGILLRRIGKVWSWLETPKEEASWKPDWRGF